MNERQKQNTSLEKLDAITFNVHTEDLIRSKDEIRKILEKFVLGTRLLIQDI